MAIPNRVWKKLTNTKLKLSDLNPHLMCVLCGGYYIDATTIVECLHSFCRSCIVKHLEGSKYCPICEVQVHKTKPLINIRPDKTLQDIVYKLVPGLFANEMQNRRDFYQERPHYIKPDDSESAGEVSEFRKMLFANSENITFSLIYLEGPSPLHMDHTRYREVTSIQRELRYFRCPTAVTIAHLKKLLKAKYELRGNNYRVDMFLKEDTLNDEYSLLDISYIYLWNTKDNLSLTFKVFEGPAKRRRRRYFGGVDELPAHFTPLSILQSRLGILANSMAEDNMSEGRRHLRSDIEKKRKEIEARIEEERRLSERELRSHDEKKREKEKEKDKKNEVKKKDKDKHDEKKKDKNHEGKEKKKEGKSNDEKKKDGKNGEEKKKNPEEKKKKKEGRCQDEKRKEKDDKEDKEDKDEEKRKDKEAKEERNREKEMKKDGENKRKREGEPEGKRKREKREEIKENNIDKKERKEVKEDGREKTVTGEATSTTSSEPDSTQTSTPTQPPVTTSSSASTTDQAQTSSSTEEGSATTSTTETPSDSTSEPTSTTATENEQKTEEADMKEDETPTSSRENRATPPKDSGDTEIQLQISESGVMSTSPVLESGGDVVRTVEERGCGRVTRRSSITGATFRDEGLGNREMRKRRGSNGKSDDGSPNDPNQKSGLKSSKTYKTICRSANLWHPSISKEKLKPTAIKGKEQAKKPAKFFKLRGKTRSSGNPPSDEKPAHEDPVLKEVEEEEELPQHEVEKEEAQVEPEAAHVAIRDEGEEKRIEEEKRRIEEEEEEKKQNEEEKRKLEEDNKMETTPTNNNSALKGDPKTFGPLDKDDKCSMIVGASAPDLPTNLKADPKTFGPLDKEDRCSTIVGANAPNLPTNLKGDPKTFEALDNDDKSSTIVGASAPDLPANLIGDPKTFGPLEKEDKCSMIVGASAPNLPTNLKGDANIFGPPDKEGNGSTIVGASAPDLPTNLKGGSKSFGAFEKEDKCSMIVGASAPNLPTNLKGDLKNFGSHDKEERCATIVGASAPNLLTNPFIPNTSQVFSCDGNYSKWAESKLDKSLLGKAVPGVGGLGAGLGVGSGIGSVGFQNPVPNGGSFSPMCFLDPSRFVYPYQTYRVPDNQSIFRGPPLPTFGNMGHFGPVTGFHASLPPCINNLSSPHQNVQVVSLVSQKKNKDDSTKEGIKSCEDPLNPEKERKKRRRAAETEVTNFLKKEAPGKGTKMDEEEDEDDEKIFVPAKRKRDEKGSRDKEKKEKPKEDKAEKMEDEGPA